MLDWCGMIGRTCNPPTMNSFAIDSLGRTLDEINDMMLIVANSWKVGPVSLRRPDIESVSD
jgi:hypothetical protein